MSRIRADRYTNREGTGAPTFADGVNVVGISSLGITTVTGVGQTALTVNGDARITGVLTVGQGSVTIDGTSGNSSITGVTTAGIGSVYGVDSINDLGFPNAGPLSNRNLVINGAMTVAQRGTTVSTINSAGYHTVDRFKFDVATFGVWTSDWMTNVQGQTYENGATERFRNALRVTCTTPDTSPASTDNVKIQYFIEGSDLQAANYGQVTAKDLTLSFWVKSNKTGAATFEAIQEDNSEKQFSASYTINAANTWEKKVIVIPADTAGQINNDNGRGLDLIWWLNSGTAFTGGSQGGWRALVNANRNSDNIGVGSAANDEFYLTGVQLEVGSKATPFEHRSYGQELALCQRYFCKIDGLLIAAAEGSLSPASRCIIQESFPMPMRATPTQSFNSSAMSNVTQSFISRDAYFIYGIPVGGSGSPGFVQNFTANAEL